MLDGDHYVINGAKIFTTNSGFADTFVVFAMTDKSKGTKGISAFVIDRNTPGLTVGKNIHRMGIRAASNCEVAYENVRIRQHRDWAKKRRIHDRDEALDGAVWIAAQATGIAQGAIERSEKYVKEKTFEREFPRSRTPSSR